MSKNLAQLIQERTGISEAQATQVVEVVSGFLKERLPAPIAGQIDGIIGGDVSAAAGQLDGLMGGLGGMFGKKD